MSDEVIDCIGEMCPIPIVRAEKMLKNVAEGDSVTIKTDHSCTSYAVAQHFQMKLGYPCASQEIDYGIWEITIKKQTPVNK